MLEIKTIDEFLALPSNLRDEIQKAMKTKDRLEAFLRSQNKRTGNTQRVVTEPHWEKCKRCSHWGQPGWVWVEEHQRNDADIHPSQIDKCLKFLWHSCMGDADKLEEFIDPRLQMIFDIGHAWHETVQTYGRKGAWGKPEWYRPEVEMDPDAVTFDGHPVMPLAQQYWIRGHVDAVLDRYEIDNVPGIGPVAIRVVHEYKTINSNGYQKLNRPQPKHKRQATMYAAVFNAPIVVYLYTSKDDCKTADFPVPFDHTIWNEIVQKIYKTQHYVNLGTPPPWEETSASLNPSECMDCGFRKLCQPPITKLRSP